MPRGSTNTSIPTILQMDGAWVLDGAASAGILEDQQGDPTMPLISINTISDLRAYPAPSVPFLAVQLLGYYYPGDGGGGVFIWDLSTSAPDNNGTVIWHNGGALLGSWRRQYSGFLWAPWFGATGKDGSVDCGQNILWLEAAANDGDTLYFPRGTYKTTLPVVSAKRCNWCGDGYMSAIFMDGNCSLLSISDTREIVLKGLALFSGNTDSSKATLDLTEVHASDVDLHILGGYNAFRMTGCLLDTARLHISQNTGGTPSGWTPSATVAGITLRVATAPSQIACNANTFINPVLEGLGTGFVIDGQNATPGVGGIGETDNQISGGTIESCNLGISCDGVYQPTIIDGTHFEQNGQDLNFTRSSNIVVRNSYIYSFTGYHSIALDQSSNIFFENSIIHTLDISSTCSRVESKRCILRKVFDNSPDARFDNIQYLQTGESPYGISDGSVYGRVVVPDQVVINSNPTLSTWTLSTVPDGYGIQGAATISQEFSVFRKGTSSAKIVAPYAPSAFSGLTYPIPASLLGQWITVEAWSYSGLAGNLVICVGKTGNWRVGVNFSTTINGWIKHTVSFLVDANSDKLMLSGSFNTPSVAPAYVDSVRIYARTWD